MENRINETNENKDCMAMGYLQQSFRLFHIKDKKQQEFDYHYHNFHKIIIFLSGNVSYIIEGKIYDLKPWDILLVHNRDIHKAVIHPKHTYERIIIWLQDEFIRNTSASECDLTACFQAANEKQFNLIRLPVNLQTEIQTLLQALEASIVSHEFGSQILSSTYFLQLMVALNRVFLPNQMIEDISLAKYDRQIADILKYINLNLGETLSNDSIAEKFFLSKYYLMHKFKQETGYSLHNYIQQKRLLLAAELIKQELPIIKACTQCGFQDYSTFLRAFKKMFQCSPRDYYNRNRPAIDL